MHALTKTYITAGFIIIALFEYWSAMEVFGFKGQKRKGIMTIMRLHRIVGYIFAVMMVWISWVCVDLMKNLYAAGNYSLDIRNFTHGALSVLLLLIWALKVSVVRRYKTYRPYVPLMGIILVIGTILLWAISGWFYLIITGARQAV